MEEKKEVVEHKKKKVWLIVVVMLIIGLALGIGGSYVYFEVMDNKTNSSTVKDNNSKQDTKKDCDKNQITDISVDSVYINNLISQYDLYVVGGYELIDIYYRKDKTVISELSENYLRALVMKNERCQFSHQNCYVTGDQFQKKAKMLYGNQVKLDNKSWSGTSCVELVINYNNTTNIYQPAEQSGACGGTSMYFFQRDVIAATKSPDKLEVTIAYVIVNGETNEVFADYEEGKPLMNKVEGLDGKNLDIRANASKLHQFKYVFTYDKTNDGYYLNYIEKIK